MAQLTITLEELEAHNTLDSLWIAVHGSVYDLTNFVSDHPGGVDALHTCAGSDGTEAYDYASHSKSNMKKMQQYLVGKLDGYTEAEQTDPPVPTHIKTVNKGHSRALPRKPLALAASSISTALALAALRQRGVFRTLTFPLMQLGAGSTQNAGLPFWAGMALASIVSCAGFLRLYKLYQSTLDYQNDVFSFPPVIPRKARK
ncbi:hypothetical protein VHEMI08207 [[Torrubiella] hemipterigena]|uniref:Cytochrome b5 heme-binding domain-containing protein n=1 Tax=[Torrubiella] hemipterigena TaxID=1531966 RepID=A0A0A1TPA4_9HYPO|nr:hypothetical protein VHEMI08207 [[Torrubiella] hemipterigena]